MRRHICVVTTSRADFGHLHWPLVKLRERPQFKVSLLVIGAHLAPEFGRTERAIRDAGFEIAQTIECLLSSDTGVGMAKTIGIATLGVADALDRLQPDIVLVPADRYEMLAVASAALALRIPIAHLEGGDISEGAIDDAVRNALTKMSHIHLTPTANARLRVLAMGEEAWRVHQVGAPSLDHLTHSAALSKDQVAQRIGVTLGCDLLLVAFHPVTLLRTTQAEADALYDVLENTKRQIIFCFPNVDAGSHELIRRAQAFCSRHAHAHLFVNLDHWTYWNVLRYAAVMLGNSSSAIMEAPALHIPVVDIGERQRGREKAANIIHVDARPDAINRALKQIEGDAFAARLANVRNPYGDGHAAQRIVDIFDAAPERDRLLQKKALPLNASGDGFVHDGDHVAV